MFAEVPLFPEQASTSAEQVDHLLYMLLTFTVPVGLGVAGAVIFFAIKFRRRRPDQSGADIHGSIPLELAWTLIPFLIFLVIYFWGASVYSYIARPPEGSLEVYVVGKQWMWKFQHPEGQREINTLHVPVGRPVKLVMVSEDVIHSFFVPAFRLHQDVLPGRFTYTWFQATKPGTYHLFCSQYCGTNHSGMIGSVIVMEEAEYQNWLSGNADGSLALKGRQLFLKLQCITCHSADARARAPVLEGLYGTDVHLADGRTVRADESYLRRSIVRPRADVVQGYEPIMPPYEGQVDEEEMIQLIAFIKALKPGQTPVRTEESAPPIAAPQGGTTKP